MDNEIAEQETGGRQESSGRPVAEDALPEQTVNELPETARHFTMLLSSTRRGARLARRLAVQQLIDWNLPYETAELIVAELASNAVLHGRVPGRSFRLTLRLTDSYTLRIEVTDTRADALPRRAHAPACAADSGWGLLLVETLSLAWGTDVGPVPRKTVWAEVSLG